MRAKRHLRLLLRELRHDRRELAAAIACMAAVSALALIVPPWTQRLIQEVYPAGGLANLAKHLLWGVAIAALIALLTFYRDYWMHGLSYSVSARIRSRMFAHVLAMPLRPIPGYGPGELISRHSHDISSLQYTMRNGAAVFLPNAMVLICLFGAMLWHSWLLTLLTLAMLAPLAGIIAGFGKKIFKAAKRSQDELAELTRTLDETLAGAREIKSFGREGFIQDRFEEHGRRSVKRLRAQEKKVAMHPPVIMLASAVSLAVLMLIGAWMLQRGAIASDRLIGFVVCLILISAPLQELSRSMGYISVLFAVLDRFEELLDTPREKLANFAPADSPKPQGAIRFERVCFSYGAAEFNLHEIDFEIRPGEILALVGPSGSGKSTLLDLIPRFIEPESGRILLDGADIAGRPLESLRQWIALVAQQPVLFEGTVLENLLFAKPGATMQEVHAAARAAHAAEFIERLPLGYDTPILPRANNLSVGQRQRLAIARALLKDPRILLLDEPTSALDPASETIVREALQTLMQGRTTLIAAHRLSTIRAAGRIAVLNHGRIREIDTHENLLLRRGLYFDLFNEQIVEGQGAAV